MIRLQRRPDCVAVAGRKRKIQHQYRKKGGGKDEKDIQMTKTWLTVRMSPKDYARMIGHSERFVRQRCMPVRLRGDRNARIELRIATEDVLANCHKLTGIDEPTVWPM